MARPATEAAERGISEAIWHVRTLQPTRIARSLGGNAVLTSFAGRNADLSPMM